MVAPVNIKGDNYTAKVSKHGELLTGTFFSSAEKITLTSDNVAVTIVKPRAGQKMILTGLIVNTSRATGTDTLVQIFESAAENSSVVSKAILSFDMPKSTTIVTSSLLIQATEGVYINAVSDDSDVNVTLLCYFVSA